MKIEIQADSCIPGATAAVLSRRLEVALGRFSRRIRRVSARLSDVNGPRGGIDKRCLIEIRLEGKAPPIVIDDADVDAIAVVSRAAERAGRAVARVVESMALR